MRRVRGTTNTYTQGYEDSEMPTYTYVLAGVRAFTRSNPFRSSPKGRTLNPAKARCDKMAVTMLLTLFSSSSAVVFAQERLLPLPGTTEVRGFQFHGPGCDGYSSLGRSDIESLVAFLKEHSTGWKKKSDDRYAEFRVSMDVGERERFDIRFGRRQQSPFLEWSVGGETLVHDISDADLSRLLKLCKCNLSIAFLERDKGYYGTKVERVLTKSTRIESKHMDRDMLQVLFDAILDYGRANPQDTEACSVLRTVDAIVVDDVVNDWYVFVVDGWSYHLTVRFIVNAKGKATRATPQACLRVLRAEFGDLKQKTKVEQLCAKILQVSGLGTIVGNAKDIPGIDQHPLASVQQAEIQPMREHDSENSSSYVFFVYERLGGFVWRCELVVSGEEVRWEQREFARGVGDAWFIK